MHTERPNDSSCQAIQTPATVRISKLDITTPKRRHRGQAGWEGFFPYYAGFPEDFAERILKSSGLSQNAKVLDPWNGSGTTTYTSARMGISSVGIDLNPVMTVIARARLLPSSEADSLLPLGKEILARAHRLNANIDPNDPLFVWFGPSTSAQIRRIELSVRRVLIGQRTLSQNAANLTNMSALAATFYVALFALCRELSRPFQSSNPTWLRLPRQGQRRASRSWDRIVRRYLSILEEMDQALCIDKLRISDAAAAELYVADTASKLPFQDRFDLVLTSPPYCTRIDYTAATRVQLAVLSPIMGDDTSNLRKDMLGSVLAPKTPPCRKAEWGDTCESFISSLLNHKSKASQGYYYRTHLDYFEKLQKSLRNVGSLIRPSGLAIMVVQDSYYKEIHNDLPTIVAEMAAGEGLALRRKVEFPVASPLSSAHPHAKTYRTSSRTTETVLCFERAG
jgi:hypothetical protein